MNGNRKKISLSKVTQKKTNTVYILVYMWILAFKSLISMLKIHMKTGVRYRVREEWKREWKREWKI